jgi:dienelactone hydrolase
MTSHESAGQAQAPNFEPAKTVKISDADRARFETALNELDEAFGKPHVPFEAMNDKDSHAWNDVEIGRKALRWILKHDEFYQPRFVAMTDKVIAMTRDRLANMHMEHQPAAGFGRVYGYLSRVDGSVQPYAVYLPPEYEPNHDDSRQPLLVILHGRNQTLNEVSFIDAHEGKPYPKSEIENGTKRIVLHVFGRTNNAYRWSGEMDVIESLQACQTRFPIDPAKVDLQGFSMGGAGAWHLGLHRPDLWKTVEAGAGFNETRKYARRRDLKPWEEKTLHIYDAFEIARNVSGVPTIGYGGEEDPQLQASTNILDQLKSEGFVLKANGLETTVEGFDFLRLIGAKMGHKVDPASRKTMDAFVKRFPVKKVYPRIDFVTYSLKHPGWGGILIYGLDRHYDRAWVQADVSDDGKTMTITRLDNVRAFRVERLGVERIVLDGVSHDLPGAGDFRLVVFEKSDGKWIRIEGNAANKIAYGPSKRFGLTGPIDEAFTMGFIVVAPDENAPKYSKSIFEAFSVHWSKHFRGDLPVVTEASRTPLGLDPFGASGSQDLILFGDAKSNPVIAKVLPKLPQIRWTESEFTLDGKTYSTKDHYPTLIAPNPLNPDNYVVINSGHTFGQKDSEGTNALLYPRMGDWGVVKIKADGTTEIVDSGFFDENWMPSK